MPMATTQIKLVLTDLDGTVVPNLTDEVSKANMQAIRQATGGALVARPADGAVVWERLLDLTEANQALEILRPHSKIIGLGDVDQEPHLIEVNGIKLDTRYIWAAMYTEYAEQAEAEINKIPGLIAHLNAHPWGDKRLTGIQVTHIEADKEHGSGPY